MCIKGLKKKNSDNQSSIVMHYSDEQRLFLVRRFEIYKKEDTKFFKRLINDFKAEFPDCPVTPTYCAVKSMIRKVDKFGSVKNQNKGFSRNDSLSLAVTRISNSRCPRLNRNLAYDGSGNPDKRLTVFRSLIENHILHCETCRDNLNDLDYFDREEPNSFDSVQVQELRRRNKMQEEEISRLKHLLRESDLVGEEEVNEPVIEKIFSLRENEATENPESDVDSRSDIGKETEIKSSLKLRSFSELTRKTNEGDSWTRVKETVSSDDVLRVKVSLDVPPNTIVPDLGGAVTPLKPGTKVMSSNVLRRLDRDVELPVGVYKLVKNDGVEAVVIVKKSEEAPETSGFNSVSKGEQPGSVSLSPWRYDDNNLERLAAAGLAEAEDPLDIKIEEEVKLRRGSNKVESVVEEFMREVEVKQRCGSNKVESVVEEFMREYPDQHTVHGPGTSFLSEDTDHDPLDLGLYEDVLIVSEKLTEAEKKREAARERQRQSRARRKAESYQPKAKLTVAEKQEKNRLKQAAFRARKKAEQVDPS